MKKRIIEACIFTALLIGCTSLVFALTGCAAKQGMVEFNPSNSMCLDATVVNLQAAGCKAVSVTNAVYGITKITCYEWDTNVLDADWINNEFYAIAFGTRVPDDVRPICTDPYLIMTMAEKD